MTIERGHYGRLYVRLWPWPLLNIGKYHDFGIVQDGTVHKRDDGSYYMAAHRIVLALNQKHRPLTPWRKTSLA